VSAEEVGAERGVLGVYPGGGRSIWLLGMLITFKAVGEETGGEYSVFEQTVPPRAEMPPHIHHRESEAFYVLEGEFDLLTGGQATRAGAGEFVLVP
jgi:quercetin dioxygenase-like cupin family protein